MKNHPNMCDRMKNARNYGQVNLQEFSQSIQSTGYNNDLYDNGIKIAKSNHKRKKTNKPTGKIRVELLVIVPYLGGDKLFQCFSGSRFR